MKIISLTTNAAADPAALSIAQEKGPALFLDLETTGLSPERDRICLIGCAAAAEDGYQITQWFDDTGREEKEILASFLIYASSFETLVHFNGERFDLPFLKKRAAENGLESMLHAMRSLDLYRIIKPYKALLPVPDLRQQTLENFIGTGREEQKSGKEVLAVYKSFLEGHARPDDLLLHNENDVRGLISMTSFLLLPELFSSPLTVLRARADSYAGPDGKTKEELVMTCSLPESAGEGFGKPLFASRDDAYMNITGTKVTLRVPLAREEMKYFYAGWKDYYYLPESDQAVHKSLASFVDPSRRRQAKASDCYTRKTSSFLPSFGCVNAPVFRRSFNDPALFFELTDDLKKDRAFFNEYASLVMRHITGL